MVEFALIIPIITIILVGIFEFSILYYDQDVITSASREGVRYGIVKVNGSYPTSAQIIAYAKTFCTSNLLTFNATNPSVTVTVTLPGTVTPGAALKVTVAYTYTDYVLHNFISHGQSYALTASTTMNYE